MIKVDVTHIAGRNMVKLKGILRVPILPPKRDADATTQISFRVPKKVLNEIDGIAKNTGYNRTEVLVRFLEWATAEYRKEQQEKKRK